MDEPSTATCVETYGSEALNKMLKKLKATSDPRRRYEYVLWLAQKLPTLSQELRSESIKVKGCISQVYVLGELKEGRLLWKGYSDALITKGLLSLLIESLNNLTPEEVLNIDEAFIKETGLNTSLTPSRANGFLNILLHMKSQALEFSKSTSNKLNKV